MMSGRREALRTARAKYWDYSDSEESRTLEFFRVPEIQAKYPETMRRIRRARVPPT